MGSRLDGPWIDVREERVQWLGHQDRGWMVLLIAGPSLGKAHLGQEIGCNSQVPFPMAHCGLGHISMPQLAHL